MVYNSSANENSKFGGMYAGGYIPADTENTSPCVLLRGHIAGTHKSYSWGHPEATGNYGQVVGAYDGLINGSTHSAFVGPGLNINEYPYYSLTRSGKWGNAPVILQSFDDSSILGAFGKYSFMHGHEDRADASVDGGDEYIVTDDLMQRWKPSA